MTNLSGRTQLSWRRRWLFAAILLPAAWVFAELASFALLSLMKGKLATPARLRADRAEARIEALAHTAVRVPPKLELPAWV